MYAVGRQSDVSVVWHGVHVFSECLNRELIITIVTGHDKDLFEIFIIKNK